MTTESVKIDEEDKYSTSSSSIGTNTTEKSNIKTSSTLLDSELPCEPGTNILLEGIIWNETTKGVLILNVTWRGKSFVGTLLDSTQSTWAPPRFKEPLSNTNSKTTKNQISSSLRAYNSNNGISSNNGNNYLSSNSSSASNCSSSSNHSNQSTMINSSNTNANNNYISYRDNYYYTAATGTGIASSSSSSIHNSSFANDLLLCSDPTVRTLRNGKRRYITSAFENDISDLEIEFCNNNSNNSATTTATTVPTANSETTPVSTQASNVNNGETPMTATTTTTTNDDNYTSFSKFSTKSSSSSSSTTSSSSSKKPKMKNVKKQQQQKNICSVHKNKK